MLRMYLADVVAASAAACIAENPIDFDVSKINPSVLPGALKR